MFYHMHLCTLVGMRTGPFTFRFFSLAPRIKSAQTEVYKKTKLSGTSTLHSLCGTCKNMAQNSVYSHHGLSLWNFYPHREGHYLIFKTFWYLPFSRDLTLRLVRVMRMRWMATSVSTGALPVSLKACVCKINIWSKSCIEHNFKCSWFHVGYLLLQGGTMTTISTLMGPLRCGACLHWIIFTILI